MRDLHDEKGARFETLRGVEVVRSYGDPLGEVRAATAGASMRDRSHRTRLRIGGRSPGAMLQGVVTGTIPGVPTTAAAGVRSGRVEPSAVLTPKGRVVSDLRLWREPGDEEAFGMDVPAPGAAALAEHFARVMPPRLARVEDVSDATGMLTFMGPEAAVVLSRDALGLRVETDELLAMAEGDSRAVEAGPLVIRSADVATPAWDVIADRPTIRALWRRAIEAGVVPVGSGVWEALRLEAGRPAFGADFGGETLLPETGLERRLVDGAKGCYTGQEVVVRIRDRGHVNKHLRRLRLGEGPTPAPGSEVWAEGHERPIGTLTSVAESPRLGPLALAYVRREVEPAATVHIGGSDGASAVVEALPG